MTPAERLAIELGAPRGDRDGSKVVPMLCGRDESGERILGEPGFVYEVKLDGVRIVADKRKDRVALGYRKLRVATASYPEIAEAVAKLEEQRVVLDGEVVAFDAGGRPDFQRLGTRIQSRGKDAERGARAVPVVYVVFDVLVVGDRDVTGLPLEARKVILERVVGAGSEHLRLHPVFSDGRELFRQCRAHRLEGVVAKRAGSTYRPDDRSDDWVKVKCELHADLVVIGWTEGAGKRARLGALDVGAFDASHPGRLVARGTVGSGLDDELIAELLPRLRALEVPKQLAEGALAPKTGRRFFTKPEIVVSVRYLGITNEGLMRHPVFRGVRHDLAPEECVLGSTSGPSAKSVIYSYYEAAAPLVVPYLRGRLCPLLAAKTGARLWPLPSWMPSRVRAAVVPAGIAVKNEMRGAIVDDAETLVALLEAGCGSLLLTPVREDKPALADFVALRVAGAGAWKAALAARELVGGAGLTAFAKTAGPGAYDVLVPIGDAPADGARLLGALFVRLLSDDAALEGTTIEALDAPVAPWAVVLPASPGAAPEHVSLPLRWDDANDADDSDDAEGTANASSRIDRVHERIRAGAIDDPMRAMLSASVDFGRAVAAIESLVAARSSFVRDPRAR